MSFSINDSGSIGYPYGKNETGPLSHKRGRKNVKWIKVLDVKLKKKKKKDDKAVRRQYRKYLYSLEVRTDFFNKVTKSARLINLTILKFRTLIDKGSEKASHKIVICSPYKYKRLTYRIYKELPKVNF